MAAPFFSNDPISSEIPPCLRSEFSDDTAHRQAACADIRPDLVELLIYSGAHSGLVSCWTDILVWLAASSKMFNIQFYANC